MSICVDTMLFAPVASLKVKPKVCADPLPLEGVTATNVGGLLKPWNDAVSVIAPFIVTDAERVDPVNEPDPAPLQPVNASPLFGVAEIPIVCPALKNPLDGLTVPPVLADMVKKNCCVKVAVYEAEPELGTVTGCEIAPPSFQLDQINCAVLDAFCGLVTAMV